MRLAAFVLVSLSASAMPRAPSISSTSPIARTEQTGMQAAVEAVRAGDFVAAQRAASAESDRLARHQAIVYVRHQAGDLDGALAEAEIAARAFPTDAWLQDRRAYIALTLRRVRIADDAVRALARATENMNASDKSRWSATIDGYRTELTDLQRMLAARDRAEVRSLWTAIVGVLASAVLLVSLARRS